MPSILLYLHTLIHQLTLIYRLYKNKVVQSPGWDDNVIRWCAQEAKKQGLAEYDYWGGFVIDEMHIQVSNII